MESLKSRVSTAGAKGTPDVAHPSGIVLGASITGGRGSISVTVCMVLLGVVAGG